MLVCDGLPHSNPNVSGEAGGPLLTLLAPTLPMSEQLKITEFQPASNAARRGRPKVA